ncbi:MAG TPA: DUF3821 domain-containing protein [Methanospirillum sp.]|nr:DUF3821 domain-containing protein [Methanospirillum sp.]
MKSVSIVLILLCIIICHLVYADIRSVPPGGTVFIGEERIDISGTGIGSGGQIAWWAAGSSLIDTPADTITVTDPESFSATRSLFSGKEGIWYSWPEKNPVLKIKSPRLKVRIYDTSSDFDATGKWLPRGHLASFLIETNLYELGSRDGANGAPIDIIIRMPEGAKYSAVSGPSGSFSLTGIAVDSALYDTGGVWDTGGTDSGTYQIRAECTANRLNSDSADPGTAVSETIDVLIQDVNPLISGANQREKAAQRTPEVPDSVMKPPRSDATPGIIQSGSDKISPSPTLHPTAPVITSLQPLPEPTMKTASPTVQPASPGLTKAPEKASTLTPTPAEQKSSPLHAGLLVLAVICAAFFWNRKSV